MIKVNAEENTLQKGKDIIPICFSWSGAEELMIPLGVCVSSLLKNAGKTTFYDIYILHHNLKETSITTINKLKEIYANCNISYIDCGDVFSESFKGSFSTANYYKLLLPDIIIHYDKIISVDLDIIFQCDLRNIYQMSLQNNQLIAGVHIPEFYFDHESETWERHLKELDCDKKYINSGFMVINLKKMRIENTVDKFRKHQNKKYLYLEQDIINIVCKDRIESIPIKYNYTNDIYPCIYKYPMIPGKLQESDIEEANDTGIVHYNGYKPWNSFCLRQDIWMDYYKKSIFYNEKEYYVMMTKALNKNAENMSIVNMLSIVIKRLIKYTFEAIRKI
jgi:lipopolysaccharide biosynthesis glycosyltransferase